MRVRVRDAESASDLDEVRRLCREFVGWHAQQQAQNAGLVAAYFEDASWEAELAGLPNPIPDALRDWLVFFELRP